jgi:hypothetical protein
MSYSIMQSSAITIPANTSYWGTLPLNGGSVLSVGLDNENFTTKVYPTQLFVSNFNSVFFQVDNLNDFEVTTRIWVVADGQVTFGAVYLEGSTPVSI